MRVGGGDALGNLDCGGELPEFLGIELIAQQRELLRLLEFGMLEYGGLQMDQCLTELGSPMRNRFQFLQDHLGVVFFAEPGVDDRRAGLELAAGPGCTNISSAVSCTASMVRKRVNAARCVSASPASRVSTNSCLDCLVLGRQVVHNIVVGVEAGEFWDTRVLRNGGAVLGLPSRRGWTRATRRYPGGPMAKPPQPIRVARGPPVGR